jgi:putative spermidine/putrescine transport system permease protein
MVRERSAAARLARAAVRAVVALGFAFMLVPIVLVVWLSFFDNQILALPPTGYTLRWYGALLGQPQFVGGFLTSLEVAIVATGAGLVVSVPAALELVRSRFRGREAMLQFLMSPLVVPAIVIGAGLYMFFIEVEIASGIPLVGSVVGLAVAHVLLTIPWCVRLVTANLVGVDPAVEEAAQSLGATPLATLVKVTLPMIWPGIVAAALFSFVISFGNLEISLFLVSPGETTLPIAILQYLMWKIDPTIASVSVLQIVVIGAGLLLTDRFVSLTRVV